MTPKAEIAPAAAADLPALAALEAACFAVPWSEGELAATLGGSFSHVLTARAQGACVGYLCATALLGEAEILRVAVAPAARRQGIARALLREFWKTVPVDATFLEVRASNTAARALYIAEGFVETGLRRQYYEHPVEDAVCMRREA